MENIKKMLEELKDYCEKNNYHCECAVVKDDGKEEPLYCVAGASLELITMLSTLAKILSKSSGIPLEVIAHSILLTGSFGIVDTDREDKK